jgi:hypothetical protein
MPRKSIDDGVWMDHRKDTRFSTMYALELRSCIKEA